MMAATALIRRRAIGIMSGMRPGIHASVRFGACVRQDMRSGIRIARHLPAKPWRKHGQRQNQGEQTGAQTGEKWGMSGHRPPL